MASDTRTLKVVIAGDAKSARAALKTLGEGLGEADKETKKHQASWDSYWHTVNKVLAGVALGVAGAAVGVTTLGIKTAAAMEQSQIGFTTMLGSAEKAKDFLAQLQRFAASTPFEMQGLTESSQKLLAMGFQAKDIIPTMTAIGDAVSGLGGGQEVLDRVVVAMGQMKAKGKASAEEIMQLTEAGIPAWDMLAKKIGTDIPTAMDKVSKGAVSSDVAVSALTEGMENRFGGLMEKQSHTMAGMWSNLQDTISMAAAKMVQPLIPIVERWMPKLTEYAGKAGDVIAGKVVPAVSGMAKFFGETARFIKQNQDWLAPLVVILGTAAAAIWLVQTAVKVWEAVQLLLNLAMDANPIGAIIIAVVALAAGIAYLWTHNEGFRKAVIASWNAIKSFFGAIGAWFAGPFADFFVSVYNWLKDATLAVWNWIVSAVQGSINRVVAVVHGIMAVVDFIRGAFQRARDGAVDMLGNLLSTVIGIPGRIMSALGNLGRLLWNVGRDIIKGLIDGIESAVGWLKDKLSAVTDMIPDWKGPIEKDRVLLRGTGQVIMRGLITGFDDATPDVMRSLGTLTADIGSGGLAAGSIAFPAGGGTVVNVGPFHIAGTVTAERDLAKAIAGSVRDEIARKGKRNGGRTGL